MRDQDSLAALFCVFQQDSHFPMPDMGPYLAPSQLKNEQKLPKMVYIVPNFLVLHFW